MERLWIEFFISIPKIDRPPKSGLERERAGKETRTGAALFKGISQLKRVGETSLISLRLPLIVRNAHSE